MKIKANYLALILLILVMFSLNAVVAYENVTLDNSNDIVSVPADPIQAPSSGEGEFLASTDDAAGEKISSNDKGDMLKSGTNPPSNITVNGTTFADIQEAIDNSGSGATIFLNGKYYNGNDMRITIDKNIIIDGSSSSNGNLVSTLDANNFRRIMYSTGTYNVTLRNLVLKNGFLNNQGYFAYFTGGNITLENIVISNQYISGTSLTNLFFIGKNSNLFASNITFANNTIISRNAIQGILFNVGESSKVTIDNLNFYNNSISSSNGKINAAICIGSDSNIILNNVNFYRNNFSTTNNINGISGGVAYLNTYSTLDAENISFYENSFYSRTLSGSIAYLSKYSSLKMKNVMVNDNYLNLSGTSSIHGGFIYVHTDSNSTLENFNFNHNNLTSQSSFWGGCIYLGDRSNSTLNKLSFKHNNLSSFRKNNYSNNISTVNFMGGFFYSGSDSNSNVSDIDVTNNIIVANGIIDGGTFRFNGRSNLTLTGFNFEENYMESTNRINCGGLSLFSGVSGGSETFSRFNITNLAFRNNRVISPYIARNITDPNDQGTGGLFKVGGAGNVSNVEFTNNFISKAFGGCLQLMPVSLDNPIIFENSRFINTTMGSSDIDLDRFHYHDHGGVICVNDAIDASAIIRNCTFVNNCNSLGGAICPHNHCIIEDCKFINNTATKFYGGAISTNLHYINRNETTNASITIIDCYFEGNKAPLGGAIQAMGDNIHIYGCTFVNNSAVKGGAVFLQGNTIDIHNSTFTDNFATENLSGVIVHIQDWLIYDWNIEGGAIHILGSDAHLFNNTFRRNVAYGNETAGQGGAIYVYGNNANVSGSHFDDNFAYGGNGSATYIYGLNAIIENSEFFNHSSSRGTVYIFGNGSVIQNSTFEHNAASSGGGAIYIYGNYALIDACYFNDNNATIHGGAIHTHGDHATIVNSKFYYNNAVPHPEDIEQGLGGAVFIRGNNNEISKSIFDGNTARNGSAIYNRGEDLHINDDDFLENQAFSYLLITTATPQSSYYNGSNQVLINITLVGGDNIINAIYHDDSPTSIFFHNVTYEHSTGTRTTTDSEIHPVDGAEKSQGGKVIYQDSREDSQIVTLLIVKNKESNSNLLTASRTVSGDVIVDTVLKTGLYGDAAFLVNDNLSVGTYSVYSEHPEDRLYKQIENETQFRIAPQADLELTKSVSNTIPNPGDLITWTIKVVNKGPTYSQNVFAYDKLPEGLIYVSDDSNGKYDKDTGKWLIGDLENGASAVLKIKAIVNVSNTKITNKANVTSDTYDPNESNNNDSETITVPSIADVSVVKDVSETEVSIDDIIVWTITVTNNGPEVAKNVLVSEVLPSGLELIDFKASVGSYSNDVWNVGTLENGSSETLELTTKVTMSNGVIKNVVTVTTSSYDSNMSNNKDESSVKVSSLADLEVVKEANVKQVKIGDTIIWTITVTNNGPHRAVNVVVTDRIISGAVEFVSAKASKGYFDSSSFIWLMDDLDVGETAVLQIVCTALSPGQVINYVNVTSDAYDPIMDNNEDNATVEVVDEPQSGSGNKVELETLPATGNPLMMVVLSLFSIIFVGLKRKD